MTVALDKTQISQIFANLCSEAGAEIMKIYRTDFATFEKSDASPVTEADRLAEAIILEGLAQHFPDIPVLAEESFEAGLRPEIGARFILVDPVDGTKEFIRKNDEFTVNIALIEDRRPVAGCVYAPALNKIYVGADEAWAGEVEPGAPVNLDALDRITTRERASGACTVVMSRSHADEKTLDFAQSVGATEKVSAGSSLKFCLVAEGRADVYPRFGPTREWDTGAGHAVLNAAGGAVLLPDGTDKLYAQEETEYLNGPFIAWAKHPGEA